MNQSIENFGAKLAKRFAGAMDHCHLDRDQVILTLPSSELIGVCTALRDEDEFAFAQLIDLAGVDYSTYGQADWQTTGASTTGFSRAVATGQIDTDTDEYFTDDGRFAVVYQLLSIKHNHRLTLRCFVYGDPPIIPSVINIWNSANWYEREAFDLYGILFDGHPDLRRLLTDYGFIGHPFRKDFPLEGNVEVRYDEEKGRVVYQPVTIENRVLVPRVIRDDKINSDQDISTNNEESGRA